ncbi:MAG TPA: heme-binding domain-containing protein [Pyrinomonadaceae bacterium]|nr:heme-binding domain-containing protein [Pyrinomonadaceae bacterium]
MKRILKITILVLAIVFVALQFFQIDKTNAAVDPSQTIESVMAVPPDVKIILGKACNDCHTNTTVYPWYSYIQPNGWFLKSHIDDGKRHLNLSIFATYDEKKRQKKLEEICEEVRSGNMPLPSYTWIHRDAILTESEKTALCDWTKSSGRAG